jgi:hypothetical protein
MMRCLLATLLALLAVPAQAQVPTYSAGFYNVAVGAAANDVVCLENAGSRAIRMVALNLYGVGAANGTVHVSIVLRSTANSGGTSTTPAPVALSGTQPATGVLRVYTADPVPGTLYGVLREGRWDITTNGNAADPSGLLTVNPNYIPNVARLTLKGSGSDPFPYAACVTFNGTGPASTLTGDVSWTEEAQ